MASKIRSARETQKTYWASKLSQRIDELKAKGIEGKVADKDPVVRKLKAKVRESTFRLTTISSCEKKIVDMAKAKEEKLAAPPKVKGKKVEAAPVEPVKDKKKKKKDEGGDAAAPKKEPKKKAEKAEPAAS